MTAPASLPQESGAPPQTPAQAHAAAIRMDLREREATLSADVARMEGQRPVMEKQIRDGGNSPFVMAHQHSLAQLDVQLAGARAELAAVRAQLAKNTVPEPPQTFTAQPVGHFDDPGFLGKISPDAITAVFVMLAVGIIVPLSLGLARRLTRRPAPPPSVAPDIVMARLDRVDQALDA